jgi:hypothetical protein
MRDLPESLAASERGRYGSRRRVDPAFFVEASVTD